MISAVMTGAQLLRPLIANGNSLLRWTPFKASGRGPAMVVDLTYNSLEKPV